jgi:uncharacterized phage protein (TIGR01671 family)
MQSVKGLEFIQKKISTPTDDGNFWIDNFADMELMQFTGLYDKNGVEIYEGDIIQLDSWKPKRWEVTFNRGGFCMRDKPDASYYPDCKYTEKSIVIGNIYENADLLTK